MKMQNKRFLRILIASVLTFSLMLSLSFVLSACKNSEKQTNDITSTKNDEINEENIENIEEIDNKFTRIDPDLPEMDFEGYQFNVLHWIVSAWGINGSMDMSAEELNGDVFNDAVFNRNKKIEEKYNIRFNIIYEDIGKIPKSVKNMVSAGDESYDLVFQRLLEVPSIVVGGYLYNLNKMEYTDFSKPWWDSNSINELSVDGKSFLAASDIQTLDKDSILCVPFNKKEARDYDLGDLYSLVKNGDWTLDTLYGLCKDKSRDLNGDGVIDSRDDFIAFVGFDDVTTAFFNGGGGKIAEKDRNDLPYLTFLSPRNVDLCGKILDFMYDKSIFINGHLAGDPDIHDVFPNGNGLFTLIVLGRVQVWRNSDVEFGILPVPKMSKEQESYHSPVSVHTTGFLSVPVNAPDIERTGIIIEAWAAESRYTVIPAYYEIALKRKYIRDDESSEILDLLMNTRLYDLGEVYAFGGFNGTWLRFAATKSKDIVSAYEKAENSMNKGLEKFVNAIKDMD